ncbi:Glu/Leu/Phe/Val dehydrogenase [Roseomonas eburnea]|uniref:Glutamate dehydrogenase n=1 Tax=Neoroseomonas eburnea TaxID=1346889 RepID=A0A9X9XJ38_9PROT|nr:Glu/Leu/Phe/Val dehydrogenase [Neoroseomonas eburnea]MBR0683724.1 Glu/Leu/Phe/Val dehydrogenase [Neoroseomonas eburnea]
MTDPFAFADDLGPEQVVHIHRPGIGLRAVLVVDNTACGPAIGGVRMAADADAREAFRLARAMTMKNAAAGLSHGGGKAVVIADPRAPAARKEALLRAFAQATRDVAAYIPGPDMGTNETCMAWIREETGRAVGLPRAIGGIPLDEIGATGIGLGAAVGVAAARVGLPLAGARVAVQGFGAVGHHAARVLVAQGAALVAASDTMGTIIDPAGLDVAALAALKAAGRPLADHAAGRRAGRDAILDVPCDIWIPAARPDVIDATNVHRLQARILAQGANIPCTAEAEAALHARGVLVLPDFIANAGGVICAAVEYHGGNEEDAIHTITTRIHANTEAVLEEAARAGTPPRAAALRLAERRVRAAMALRRFA